MGILDRLRGATSTVHQPSTDAAVNRSTTPAAAAIGLTVSLGSSGLVKLTGTTTIGKDAAVALANRHGTAEGGYLEMSGVLQREPDNPVDPNAVAVFAEGERIGYLPGYLASGLDLSVDGARTISVQMFTEVLPKGLRMEAWGWLGTGTPQWDWSRDHRPPMSSEAKAAQQQKSTSAMVGDALAGGGPRAQQFEAGMVNGVHYLELIEPIKELKRENRLDEALVLCYAAIQGAEGDAANDGTVPAPWYTEQAAIIHHKLGQTDDEVEVLKRWLAKCPPNRRAGSGIQERLNKILGG